MEKSARGRPRSRAAHDAVLAAAADQLLDIGLDRMSMEGIAAGAGVSKQTIYRWWPSKAAIVAEAVLAGEIAVPALAIPDSGDVIADLRDWMTEAVASLAGGQGGVIRATSQMTAEDPELAALFLDRFTRPAREVLAERLDAGSRAGQIVDGIDPFAVSDALFATIVYASLQPDSLERVGKVVELLLAGLVSRP